VKKWISIRSPPWLRKRLKRLKRLKGLRVEEVEGFKG
jgi:hypothetical protein